MTWRLRITQHTPLIPGDVSAPKIVTMLTQPGPKGLDGDDGDSLEFDWDETSLGVRVAGSGDPFDYTDLKGDPGEVTLAQLEERVPHPLPAEPETGDLMQWNGTIWVPRTVADIMGDALMPRDGPGSVLVPSASEHFLLTGTPAPTELYTCDEAGGDLAPSIGSGDLVANGSVLYQQSVTGWDASFVGTPANAAVKFAKSVDLDAGESCAVLVYLAFSTTTLRGMIGIAGSTERIDALADGTVRTRHNNLNFVGAEVHENLDVVRPYLWVRNAKNDESGMFTDLEAISATHNETAKSGDFGIGLESLSVASMRVCRVIRWAGADAYALAATGLMGPALLTRWGWELAY